MADDEVHLGAVQVFYDSIFFHILELIPDI